jgi:streptogramin lyase
MPCALTQNILKDCRLSTGGIKAVYITELANITALAVSGGTVTGITMAGSTKFRTYTFRKETGTFAEAITASDVNGTVFYAPTITLALAKLQVNTRNEIALLAQNEVAVIVLDNNGSYWLTGSSNGLTLSAGTQETGKAFGDMNGYALTLTGGEPQPMYQVLASVVTANT